MARRRASPFSLSFLDCMCCGFGAVILFFMIINTGSTRDAKAVPTHLVAEVDRLQIQVTEGRRNLTISRTQLAEDEFQRVEAERRAERLLRSVRELREELAALDADSSAREEHINRLKASLESLDEEERALQQQRESESRRGRTVRSFVGTGDRQYLTGLKIGGQRILILVDASASMLDETVVNVLRRRHLPDAEKRRSEKWQQVVSTVDWLTSQIPASGQFQIYTFNVGAGPVVAGTRAEWLETDEPGLLDKAVIALQDDIVPDGGTSLINAFHAVTEFAPRPDNIILLTDGLPTQGERRPLIRTTASANDRFDHFRDAMKVLPGGIPVNTILYPMEGDPHAGYAYWQLAQVTRGSFLSPARDWP